MRVLRGLVGVKTRRPLCLAMGVFDGMHVGHQAIVAEAVRIAAATGSVPAVLTFDPPPDSVLSPEGGPPLLTTTEEKLSLMRAAGIRVAVVAEFDRGVADTPAEEFVRRVLVEQLRARCLVVGEGWRFGAGGRGTSSLLERMAGEAGFGVSVVPPVLLKGRKVSSTRIRSWLLRGRVSEAAEGLGRAYRLGGEVVSGAGRGRQLGYPTANLATPEEKLVPGDGIYACEAGVRCLRPAVASIGVRPTFEADGGRRVEVHLLDQRRRVELLGRSLRVDFVERLRGERRFRNAEALVQAMGKDCAEARRLLSALHDFGDVL